MCVCVEPVHVYVSVSQVLFIHALMLLLCAISFEGAEISRSELFFLSFLRGVFCFGFLVCCPMFD